MSLGASETASSDAGARRPARGILGAMVRARNLASRNPVGVAALLVLVAVFILCFGAPWFTPYNPNNPNLNAILQPPSPAHWMGTTPVGEDLMSQVLYGGRVSLTVGLVSAGVSVALGGTIGVLSGYFGGWLDVLLMRLVDAALSIPVLFVALALSVIIGQTPTSIVLIIAGTSWMLPARLMRASVLSLKDRLFVEAATATGAKWPRILLKHVVPAALAPMIVNATLLVGQAIVLESTLSFLGAGLEPPYVSWGYLLNQASSYVLQASWVGFFPGLAIFVVVLCVNLVGDGLRTTLDPTLRSGYWR